MSIIENQNIVCIGTISERKASQDIQAFDIAVREISSEYKHDRNQLPKLLFIGRNDIGKKLINFIKDLENVEYAGSATHYESLKILRLAHGCINASKSEGIPRSCLESFF